MQSDSIERRFSQYRQMNGGHFLVSLNEVTNSEKILLCRSLLKEDIDFWNESALVVVYQGTFRWCCDVIRGALGGARWRTDVSAFRTLDSMSQGPNLIFLMLICFKSI